jgi:hypothetical protein
MCTTSKSESANKSASGSAKQLWLYVLAAAVGVVAMLAARDLLGFVTTVGCFLDTIGVYHYYKSPLFLRLLKHEWSKLEEVEAMPFPEIAAENFTRELFWEVTNGLVGPVVIRGAIKNSTAVNEWGKEFFVQNYPDAPVVAKQTFGSMYFKTVRTTMREFYEALEEGVDANLVSSSSIFAKHPELLEQIMTPFEADFITPEGKKVYLHQLFITPGSRTKHHAELGGNLYRQISGRKRWTMVAYEATKFMCPHFVHGSALVKSCSVGFDSEEWYARLPRMETILEPGDMFYNPPWAWHDVEGLGADGLQASTAGRMFNIKASMKRAPVYTSAIMIERTATRVFGLGKFPTGNWQQTVEDRLLESLYEFCVRDGFENCDSLDRPARAEHKQ